MMRDWLHERTKASPQKLALTIGEARWTYAELNRRVNGVCRRLLTAGVQPGDRVAVRLENGLAYVCLVHALARLGAVLVPLNTRLTPAEMTWQIEHVGAKWEVADEKQEELSIVNCELIIVNDSWLAGDDEFTIHNSPSSIHNSQAIVFTSGTSGRPKGVPLTFANHFWSATASAYRLGVLPDDLWLSVLPLYHVGGLAVIFRSCLYGTAVDLHPRFDLDAINQALDHKPISLISLVPTMLHRLLSTRNHWPARLRLILLGGAAAPAELVRQANVFPRVVNRKSLFVNRNPETADDLRLTAYDSPLVAPTYGLTEAASQVATMPPAEAARKPGSVGKPLMFTTVRILNEQGQELPPGEYGEIIVTGPTVTPGHEQFNNHPDAESQTDDASRLTYDALRTTRYETVHTGDIGYLDADGDLWIVQRRSDLIVSGGENVYPAEVEAVLRQHPAVSQVCVVGVPDAEWGQRVAAMVVAEGEVTAEQLMDYGRKQLAGYKLPRRIQFVKALPHTASGKIARQAVAQQMVDLLQLGPDRQQEPEKEENDGHADDR